MWKFSLKKENVNRGVAKCVKRTSMNFLKERLREIVLTESEKSSAVGDADQGYGENVLSGIQKICLTSLPKCSC